jgi:hypothetical protein
MDWHSNLQAFPGASRGEVARAFVFPENESSQALGRQGKAVVLQRFRDPEGWKDFEKKRMDTPRDWDEWLEVSLG